MARIRFARSHRRVNGRRSDVSASEQFGEEGVRAMLRAGGRLGAVAAASVVPEQRPALDRVAGLTAALKAGKQAGAAAAQREAEGERQGQSRGLRMLGSARLGVAAYVEQSCPSPVQQSKYLPRRQRPRVSGQDGGGWVCLAGHR